MVEWPRLFFTVPCLKKASLAVVLWWMERAVKRVGQVSIRRQLKLAELLSSPHLRLKPSQPTQPVHPFPWMLNVRGRLAICSRQTESSGRQVNRRGGRRAHRSCTANHPGKRLTGEKTLVYLGRECAVVSPIWMGCWPNTTTTPCI